LAYFLVFDHTVEVIDPVKLGNKKNKKFHPWIFRPLNTAAYSRAVSIMEETETNKSLLDYQSRGGSTPVSRRSIWDTSSDVEGRRNKKKIKKKNKTTTNWATGRRKSSQKSRCRWALKSRFDI
jgi:hypothetical protein